MKKVLTTVLLMLTVCSASAKKRVIDWPDYEARCSGIYEVSRIELDDTETRVHIKSTFLPNWWVKFTREDYIQNSQGGEKWNPTDILNGEFDKEIFMPASGDSTFILVFPPLDKKVKKIDFGNKKGVEVWGVSLEKPSKKKKQQPEVPQEVITWMNKEIELAPRQDEKPLSGPFFTPEGTIKLVGYIKGYDPRFNLKTGMIYASNELTREDFPTVVKIHPDGRFEAEFPAFHPAIYYISFDRTTVYFYGEPGITTGVILDWEDFLRADRFRDRRYEFENNSYYGPLKQINQELFSVKYPGPNYRAMQEQLKNVSYEDFKREALQKWEEAKNILAKEIAERDLLPETIAVLKRRLDVTYAAFILDFESSKPHYVENREEHPLPDNYFDFLSRFSLSDSLLMTADNFSTFINRYEYLTLFDKASEILNKRTSPEKTFFDFLQHEKLIEFSEADKEYQDFSESFFKHYFGTSSEEERKKLVEKIAQMSEAFEETYASYKDEYTELYIEPLERLTSDQSYIEKWKLREQLLKDELALSPGLIGDVPKVRELKFLFKNVEQEEAVKIVSYLSQHLPEPFLQQEAQRMYNSYFLSQDRAYDLPENDEAKVFRQIIDPYKGKYLLVDFWGIFCGPCIQGIKNMKENRDRLKGDPDLEFLFITSVDESPMDRYNSFVEEQELEHTFILSGDEYRYLRQLFRFNGIPRYILVGPDGRILNDNYQSGSFIRDVKTFTGREDL